jgi:DNA repair photolyase
MKSKGGYYEYGGDHISIQRGCENGCRYCYARFNACHRAKICTEFAWAMPIVNQKLIDKKYRKRKEQPLMFPRNHDITDCNISECIIVLKKLLKAGNQVVIV